ncbi:SpoIIE family protein phosphatase [Quadrisphaera sp. KR29]|uniref:SpoIIE family protein phosphatase n=1 Tax=Quadrisphaera sp. KR29 TaxID=3461391 RepID=UPI0040440A19
MPEHHDLFTGASQTARLMAATDWAATPVGPVAGWPQSLRAAVRTVLSSRYPMLLLWGEQYTQLYNDAYSELIGDGHPAAMGGDVRVTLADGWPVLAPIVDGAMETGVASWVPALQLLLTRSGYREEAYFSVSHAPARDDDGVVRGVLTVCSEVTEQVVGERRLRLLRELAVPADPTATPERTAEAVAEVLARYPLDVPLAALYLADRAGGLTRLAGADPLPERVDEAGADPWQMGRAAAGVPGHLHDPAGLAGLGGVRGGPFSDPVTDVLALPLAPDEAGRPLGVALVAASPARALDEGHRSFFELLAQQVGGALRTALAYQRERARAEALAELDRVKTHFFTGVSHEFRTPLTLLLGPLGDALEDTRAPLPAAQRERVEVARRGATRLLKLVDSLLAFTALEAGAPRGPAAAVDLAGLTADLASGFRSAVERAGLAFTVRCDPLPRPVAVDPEDWEKVVTNLVSNALKFTFVGGITVTLRAAPEGAQLVVADTGIGIAASDLPRLFERFHRVHGARSRSHEGSGIGLALVRELVRLHGGEVQVTSTPGTGTTFTAALPWASAAAGAPAAPTGAAGPAQHRALAAAVEEAVGWLPAEHDAEDDDDDGGADGGAAGEAGAGEDADRVRVLVVDDNADMRGYLVRLLSAQGWRVHAKADGAAGLDAALAGRHDVVLTDVMMPGLDGFDLVRTLRHDPRTAALPVVVLSARAGQDAAVEGLELGADDYLTKPFAAADLVARLRTTVQLARLRSRHTADLAALAEATGELSSDRALEDSLRATTAQARALLGGRAAVLAVDAVDGRPPVHVVDPPVPAEGAGGDAVTVPVRGRGGRALGVLTVHPAPGRRGTPQQQALLAPLAQVVAALVEGSLRLGRAHEVALTLQRSMLPDHLPPVPGLDLAVRYLPASSEVRVGGDWYDVVELPGGGVLLSAGDVAGHGLQAAAVMGQLRVAARSHALAGAGPAQVVGHLDALVSALPDDVIATVLLVRLDPAGGQLRWCSAGHPPAVLTDGSRADWLEGPVQPPLGTGWPRPLQEATAHLPEGGHLLLYTDGLVEDRRDQLDAGPQELLERVRAALRGDGEAAGAEGLVRAALGGGGAGERLDDVAVLAARRRTRPLAAAARVDVDTRLVHPADFAEASRVRSELRRLLRGARVPEAVEADLLLAASEAFNNAVEHAVDPSRPEVEVSLRTSASEVVLQVRDHGRWRPRRSSMDRGHGSALMSAAGEVHIDPGPDGTTVTVRRALPGSDGS